MVRFLHTADWQMGMKAVHAGPKASALRDIRFQSAASIATLARKTSVDFVLLAGDIFEHHDVDESVVRRTVEILNQFEPIRVFVLPGNHDPWGSGSIWKRQQWRRVGTHVTLCHAPEPIQVDADTTIYPCPLTQKRSNLDPTSWIPSREPYDSRIRIGLAHGSLDVLPGSLNFPIDPARPETAGLDYLALGDWHGFLEHGRAVYSGTHEPTSFSEKNPGNVLLVEIPSISSEPVIEPKKVAELRWGQLDLDIQDDSDVGVFEKQVRELRPLSTAVVRVTLSSDSIISDTNALVLTAIRTELVEQAFYVDWAEEPQITNVADLQPQAFAGVFRNVHDDLEVLLKKEIPEGVGQQFAATDPDVVRSARTLLHRLARQVEE